jgi:hypothetical protein
MKILAIALSPLAVLLALLLGVVVIVAPASRTTSSAATIPCVPALPESVSDVSVTPEQWRSARAIVDVGKSKGVPVRGWVIAVATALQESSLRPCRTATATHSACSSSALPGVRRTPGWIPQRQRPCSTPGAAPDNRACSTSRPG